MSALCQSQICDRFAIDLNKEQINFRNGTDSCTSQQDESSGQSFMVIIQDLISGSSLIRSVLIGVEYRNCHQTLDVYLLFAISIPQNKLL